MAKIILENFFCGEWVFAEIFDSIEEAQRYASEEIMPCRLRIVSAKEAEEKNYISED